MELIIIEDKAKWNNFLLSAAGQGGAEFLQSWEWGELLEREGKTIFRWGVMADDGLVAIGSLVKHDLPGGYFYWYAPRGPIGQPAAIAYLISELRYLERSAVFLRCEPPVIITGLKIESASLQPKKTLLLDLALPLEKISAGLHQKTRYNIRLAEKKGVEIIEGQPGDFEEFWRLMALTGERDGFRLHSRPHYQNLISGPEGVIKLFFARYQGDNIAAGIFSFWGDKVVYLHGASDNRYRNLMAPYLLQWSLIKRAREEGYKYYDFYGIDANKWPGVTRFKLGFGGRIFEYPGTFDRPFRPLAYIIYKSLRWLRNKLSL